MFLDNKLSLGTLLAAITFSTASQAGLIDFTSAAWSGANNNSSFTSGDITLTGSSTLSFNGNASELPGCQDSFSLTTTNLACAGDGIGMVNDEISGNQQQSLTVTFNQGNVNIIQIELLDLYNSEGPNGQPEIAIISLNGSDFNASGIYTPGDFGGYFATGFNANGVSELVLTASNDAWSDYSLARITTSDVPEPSSLMLLGLGLLGMAAARKK